MKNTELRIGNYINGIYETEIDRGNGTIEDVETSEVVKVAGVDGAGLSEYSIWIEDGSVEEYDSFEPIPLTEEWLLKFGFNKNITIDLYPTFNKGVINVNDGIVYIVNFGFVNHIKHVHQIQDLYFSLTGEELIIK